MNYTLSLNFSSNYGTVYFLKLMVQTFPEGSNEYQTNEHVNTWSEFCVSLTLKFQAF